MNDPAPADDPLSAPAPMNDPAPADDPAPMNDPAPADDPAPMNDPAPADDPLSALVGDVETFAARSWGRRHHLHRAERSPGPLDGVLAADDIDLLLADASLVCDDVTVFGVPETSYRRADGAAIPRVDPSRLLFHLDEGRTVALNGIDRRHPALGRWCHRLASDLSANVDANLYLTAAGGRASQRHADPHGVFAVQLAGTKRWTLWPAPDPDGDAPGPVTITLGPGDVLYVPPRWPHQVHVGGQMSVHVTLGVTAPRWSDVLAAVATERGLASLDEVLPLGFGVARSGHGIDDGVLVTGLHDRLDELAREVAADDPGATAGWVRTRFGPPPLPVVTAPLRQRLGLQAGVEDRSFCAPAGVWRHVHRDGEILVVRLADRTLTMPGHLEGPVRRALDATPFAPGDLGTWLDATSASALVGRLAREGLVVDTELLGGAVSAPPPGSLGFGVDASAEAVVPGASPSTAPDGGPPPEADGALARLGKLRIRVDRKVERVPARVVTVDDLLGPEAVDELLGLVAEHEAHFSPVEAYEEIRHDHRRSALLPPEHWLDRLSSFPDRVEALLPAAVDELGMVPFAVAGLNVQLTAHAHGNYFRVHSDASVGDHRRRRMSFVYYFHRDPKPFTGGELVLWDTEIVDGVAAALDEQVVVEPRRDTLVLFDSRVMHEVRPVAMFHDAFANSRFTVNGWVR